jgi:hypothetical protein
MSFFPRSIRSEDRADLSLFSLPAESIVDFSLGSTWTRLPDLSLQYAKTYVLSSSRGQTLVYSTDETPAFLSVQLVRDLRYSTAIRGGCRPTGGLPRLCIDPTREARAAYSSRSDPHRVGLVQRGHGVGRHRYEILRLRVRTVCSLFRQIERVPLLMRPGLFSLRPIVALRGSDVRILSRPEDCYYEKILPAVQAFRTTELSLEEKEMISLTTLIAYLRSSLLVSTSFCPLFLQT